jgi:hypothetical protein
MGWYNYQRYVKREAEETSGNEDYVDESIKLELSLRFEPSSNAMQECDCRYSRTNIQLKEIQIYGNSPFLLSFVYHTIPVRSNAFSRFGVRIESNKKAFPSPNDS